MFFSVKKPLILGKEKCRPCICYKVTDENRVTVDKLVSEGLAERYPSFVFFQNGKILVRKEADVKESAVPEKSRKRSRKETVEVIEPLEPLEPLEPSDESVENEGF